MKLHELAAKRPTDNARRVMESYFGGNADFNRLTDRQARTLLTKVRGLINEHRSSPGFHKSERNPTYLKLMVMEQGLAARISETSTVPIGTAVGANTTAAQDNATMPPSNPTVAAGDALKAQQRQQVKQPPANAAADAQKATRDLTTMAAVAAKTAQGVAQQNNQKTGTVQAGVQTPGTTMAPAAKTGSMGESKLTAAQKKVNADHRKLQSDRLRKNSFTKSELADLDRREKELTARAKEAFKESKKQARMMEGSQLYHTLLEDDLQQAQVVLAAQDMVDQIQKMLEDVTAMQFKDLPALVDQIKSQVGQNEASQFNDQVNSALGTLVENIQTAKSGVEGGVGVITGQAPVVPGEAAEEMPAELGAEEAEEALPPELGGEEEELPPELGGEENVEGELGRARR